MAYVQPLLGVMQYYLGANLISDMYLGRLFNSVCQIHFNNQLYVLVFLSHPK